MYSVLVLCPCCIMGHHKRSLCKCLPSRTQPHSRASPGHCRPSHCGGPWWTRCPPPTRPPRRPCSFRRSGGWVVSPSPPPRNDLKWQVWQAFTVIRWNDLYFSHWLPGASLHFPPNDNRFNQQSVNISVNLRLFWDKNYWWIRWWWRRAGKDKNTGRDMVQSAKLQQPLVNNKLHFSRLKSFWYFFYKN